LPDGGCTVLDRMEGGAGGETVAVVETYALEFTPTWIVAGVCSLIVLISLAAERCLHYIGKVTDPNPHRLPYILLFSKMRFSDDPRRSSRLFSR
jgi:hypothetical protein